MSARIVFMGTPEFAVPCLKALIDAGYSIPLVVTQPDKPVGRKQVMTPPPVKQLAEAHGIAVYQPAKLRKNDEALARLAAAEADLFVVVAYGKILPQTVLDIPTKGCINVHASLLPKYRGSAPIQWCIVHGEQETGVTTMMMDAGMDTGDMLLKAAIPISPDDTGVTLAEKLSQLGAQLLLETLPAYLSGELKPTPQDHDQATTIPLLNKEHGEINWNQPAQAISNQIRGLKPWPESYTFCHSRSLKIKAARVFEGEPGYAGNPGQILEIRKQGLLVRTGDGILELLRVHPADGKEMDAAAFARGQRLESGEFLGQTPAC
ncbi:MAG TPA: methionyl-tRNA formyltransferase [Candidatus Obscuribacterales bacterium]